MNETNPEIESRFLKLALSSTLKMVSAMHPEVDALETVRGHMLEICEGVRGRALEAVGDEGSPEQATAHVDALINTINEYFDYSASPMFPDVKLVEK